MCVGAGGGGRGGEAGLRWVQFELVAGWGSLGCGWQCWCNG